MHIITMLFLLSILILVHELGHFSVARMLGIKVERFGFGLPFGPILYETKWKDVTVCIHAFLLGGYVSFPDDDPDSPLPKDDYGRISNRPVWQRFCVVSAGVVANAITAFLIVLMVATFSGGIPAGKYNIFSAGLQPDKSLPAHKIGIKAGDKILTTNDVVIDSPVKFITLAKRSKFYDNYVDENKINAQMEAIKKANPELANISASSAIPASSKVVLPAMTYEAPLSLTKDFFINANKYKPSGIELTAEQQKLRNSLENAKTFTADGKTTFSDLAIATSDSAHPLNITVERDGRKVVLPPVAPNKDGMIGIKLQIQELTVPTTGVRSIIKGSWAYLSENTAYMVDGLVQLVTGKVDIRDMHGIVAITKIGGDIIQHRGLWDGLLLTALISMDLAIINLLPIPALDGGHLMFLLIEKIIGKPVDQEAQETCAKFGFIFLIGLMIFIIFNDIFALVTDKL